MRLFEKIGNKASKGLAVLVAGTMIGIGGMAYAKEIRQEGWPLPDDTKYIKAGEDIEKLLCHYKGKDVVVKADVDLYANFEGQGYKKYILDDKVFMYVLIEPGEGDSFKLEVLMDRDGNGSMETKYDINKKSDEEEFENEGLPEWVLEKAQ